MGIRMQAVARLQRRWRRAGVLVALVSMAAVAFPTWCEAQVFPGTVNGSLVDPQGFPVAGVIFEGFSDMARLRSGTWQWLAENSPSWSLRSLGAGSSYLHLAITANTNLLGPGNITQNVLLLATPIANGVDFSAETRVIFHPTRNYETACLLVYQDSDHYLALARAFCDPSQRSCAGDAIYFDRDQPDNFFGFPNFPTAVPAFAAAGSADVPVWLRISRIETNYSAYYSLNGRDWNLVGTHVNVPLTNVRVGLTCLAGGVGNLGASADFDYFALGQR